MRELEIVARVQGHPARSHLHDALVSALGLPSEVVLHSSDPPSPWAGYLECLRDIPDCTHLLIIQDDAQPCKNFAPALRLIAETVQDPICLYVGIHSRKTTTKEIDKATASGSRFAEVFWRDFVPAIAILWPVAIAERFLEWALSPNAHLPGEPNPRSDDAVIGFWMRKTKQKFLVTVPSLVQHDDSQPSVKRTDQRPQDVSRPAYLLAEDALDFDWIPA